MKLSNATTDALVIECRKFTYYIDIDASVTQHQFRSSGMAERAGIDHDHNSLKKFTRNLYHASVAILFENCGREKWTLNIHDLIDLSNNCSDLLPLTVPAENAPHGC